MEQKIAFGGTYVPIRYLDCKQNLEENQNPNLSGMVVNYI